VALAKLIATVFLSQLRSLSWFFSEQALNWALYGGEDFELVLCLSPEPADLLVQQLGEGQLL